MLSLTSQISYYCHDHNHQSRRRRRRRRRVIVVVVVKTPPRLQQERQTALSRQMNTAPLYAYQSKK